jgi:replicative DNA helicase
VKKALPPRQEPPPPTDDVSMRVLPHNLEAERSLLGAILVNSSTILKAQQRVRAADFFRRAHQILFEAFSDMSNNRVEIDLVTACDEIRRRGPAVMDEVGGPAYISSLTDGVPRSANIDYYAAIVRDDAIRRAAIRVANDLLLEAYDASTPVPDLVARADRAVIDLQHHVVIDRLVDLRTTASGLYDDLEQRTKNRGKLLGIDTGFQSINDLTNGWQAGDVAVIAARPSIGKTAFVLNTATAAARQDKGVMVFSLEMRRKQLEYRLLSSLSGVPLTRILGGWLGDQDYEAMVPALQSLHEMPIYVDDRSGQNVWDIRASVRRMKSEKKIDLVIVDYVQLVGGSLERRHATRQEEVADISRRLKVLADEASCPVIVLSQLNRGGDTRSDKRPILSDLRDSGALEQDADLVCFLHRKHHRENGLTEFIVEKARNGPTGVVNLTITRETQRFEDGGAEPEQPALPDPEAPDEKPKKTWHRRKTS